MKMNTINRTDLKHPKQHWIMSDKKQRRENETERRREGKRKCTKRCRKDHITNIQQDRRNTKNSYDNDFAKVLWQWHNTSTDSWRIQRIAMRKKWHAKYRLKKTEHCLQCCSVNKNKRQTHWKTLPEEMRMSHDSKYQALEQLNY